MFFSFSFGIDDSFEAVSEDVSSGHNVKFVVKIINIIIDLWIKENLNKFVWKYLKKNDWLKMIKMIIWKLKSTDKIFQSISEKSKWASHNQTIKEFMFATSWQYLSVSP